MKLIIEKIDESKMAIYLDDKPVFLIQGNYGEGCDIGWKNSNGVWEAINSEEEFTKIERKI